MGLKKLTIATLILLLATYSCSFYLPLSPLTLQPVCRHISVLTALTFGEHFPVRIAVGPSFIREGKQLWHAQAQFQGVDGKWNWIIFDGTDAIHAEQERFEPIYFVTIKEFIEKYVPKYKE